MNRISLPPSPASPTVPPPGAARERDLRLDFFRGMAMFIILLAHTPGNTWTLWIPARFGFSDATEIFVFCSGMASGIAFGAVFLKRSWFLGAARIAFRVWQVYWAHIAIFLATAGLMIVIDRADFGAADQDYTSWFPVAGLFSDIPGRTAETVLGLFTLTYIPGLFDILPMYLVILAMVPIVMAIYRAGGRQGVFAAVVLTWLAANLAGYARIMAGEEDLTALQTGLVSLGEHFAWLNLPAIPWEGEETWFFNPFAWQLVFFTGFAFSMRWIPAPPVRRWLVILALFVVVATVPWAWHKAYEYLTGYVPDSVVGRFLWDSREVIEPVRWKTWVGAWRFVHFLALAYLAWAAVGPGGARLRTGWDVVRRSARTRAVVRAIAAALLLVTFPYTYIDEIRVLAPALDAWIVANIPLIPARYLGVVQLIHLAALIVFLWHSIGDRARHWLVRDAFLGVVPVIRKVGTQSLAVFLVSIALSQFNGAWMDWIDRQIVAGDWTYLAARDVWVSGFVNLTGCGVLILTAYLVSWFKRQPWRDRARPAPAVHTETAAGRHPGLVPAE